MATSSAREFVISFLAVLVEAGLKNVIPDWAVFNASYLFHWVKRFELSRLERPPAARTWR